VSAFALEDGVVYHTYSAYERGLDVLWSMYQWLDARHSVATRPASGGAPRRVRQPVMRAEGCATDLTAACAGLLGAGRRAVIPHPVNG